MAYSYLRKRSLVAPWMGFLVPGLGTGTVGGTDFFLFFVFGTDYQAIVYGIEATVEDTRWRVFNLLNLERQTAIRKKRIASASIISVCSVCWLKRAIRILQDEHGLSDSIHPFCASHLR
ncbi:hypothetical protein V8C34DRAFT_68699 [Trichoderma compactum]